jgi:hypothetical protein
MRDIAAHKVRRFGSKADICTAKGHVRFTPKADIPGAELDVGFVQIADIHAWFEMKDSAN